MKWRSNSLFPVFLKSPGGRLGRLWTASTDETWQCSFITRHGIQTNCNRWKHKTRGLLFWHVEHFRGMPVLTSQKVQNQVRNEKPVRYSESSCLMGPACHWSCALSGRRHSRHTHAGRCRQWMGRWLRHRGGPPLLSPARQCCLLRGGSGKEWCFVCLYLCCGYVHREIRQKKSKNKTKPKKPRD